MYSLLNKVNAVQFVDKEEWTSEEAVYRRVEYCQKLERLSYEDDYIGFNRTSELKYGVIQSPNYPEKYTKNEECIFSLQAPKNHVVVLKYYERFEIEQSDSCLYDYLEIRDGQFGYSPVIGRYCNFNVPHLPIESSGRFLWIKFKSDDLIELSGFRIIFEFRKILKQVPIEYKLKNGLISKTLIYYFIIF